MRVTLGRVATFLLGRPLRTEQGAQERLTNARALAILSSDALSSVAYATEEILRILILAGAAALPLALPVAAGIVLLILIVAASYRQVIYAFPSGGGGYVVSRAHLGTYPSLVAGASLLIDYVLTVAVSVAAGVAAVTSAVPALYPHRVGVGLAFIAFITWGNLRGVRESGSLFAVPTYLFIGSLFTLIAAGLLRAASGLPLPTPPAAPATATHPLTPFLLLRAFASGCTALTGIEAISNGVQAFYPPESRNAARTLLWLAGILASLFTGVTLLAYLFHVAPLPEETVVSQVARTVFGESPLYYLVQLSTTLVLILAANTSFTGFPRLAAIIAHDGYLPRQLTHLGQRLVHSGSIVLLAGLAALLIVIFHGETHALIPLYAVGVFVSFTLSQAGMVRRWAGQRGPGWLGRAAFNAVGAVTTGVVLAIIAATKFTAGAWVVIILIPLMVSLFRTVHRHYESFNAALAITDLRPDLDGRPILPGRHTVIIPVSRLNKATLASLAYARLISDDVRAVHVAADREEAERLRRSWDEVAQGVPLVVIDSPYRAVIRPLVHYLTKVERREPDHVITVLLPEFVLGRWWHNLLHNQTTLFLKAALLFHPGVVIASVPIHLDVAQPARRPQHPRRARGAAPAREPGR